MLTEKGEFNTFKILLLCVVLMLPAIILVYKEPNLSTTILYCIIFCVLMFVGGLNYKIIGGVLAVVVPSLAIAFYLVMQPGQQLIENYQLTRYPGMAESGEICGCRGLSAAQFGDGVQVRANDWGKA